MMVRYRKIPFISPSIYKPTQNTLRRCVKQSAYEPSGPSGRSLPRFPWHEATRSISTPPLDGMLVHRRATPRSKFPGTLLYTWVERGTMREKCLAQEHNAVPRPGLQPGPFDPKSSALTIRPPRLPKMYKLRAYNQNFTVYMQAVNCLIGDRLIEYRLIHNRRNRRPSWLNSDSAKIEQDNCFIIQQNVNETLLAARKTVVVKRFARFRTNLG